MKEASLKNHYCQNVALRTKKKKCCISEGTQIENKMLEQKGILPVVEQNLIS